MKDIVILGSGGFGREVLQLLEENNEVCPEWNILGFVGHTDGRQELDGYPILGDDQWLLHYAQPLHVAVALGGSPLRRRVIQKYRTTHILSFPPIISRHAHVAKRASVGEGTVITRDSIVMTGVKIGDFCLINIDSTIGHEAVLNDFVTLNPSVNVSGNVTVGSGTDIGTGAHIIQGLHIGTGCVIGAGSVIIRDVPDECTIVGNPGRIVSGK